MFGLSIADLIVIGLYFGVIIYIGLKTSLKINRQEDFFLGGRKFGKLTSTFASFGQATSADGPAGVATTTFNNGASGIWASLLMLFATPLFWITSPWLRRLRILTMGDFYEERYGSKRMAATYALVASVGMMGLLSVGYIAVSKTTMAITAKTDQELTLEEQQEKALSYELFELEKKDFNQLSISHQTRLEELRQLNPQRIFSHINETWLIWTICILVMVYTAMGGLEAAVYTDMLQGIFIILLSFILIPIAWMKINVLYGGSGMLSALGHLHEQLPESFFDIFGSPKVIDFTWYFIITAAIVSGLTVVTQPNQLVTAGAAKDENAARVGFVTGTFMKRVVTIMWGVLGMAAILLFGDTITNSDLVWGYATKSLLGPFNFGLVGLMLASMMAALMSTADCLMITVSGLIVNNLYRPLVGPKSEQHFIWAGRFAGAFFLIGAALVTTQFDNILQVLKFIWEFFVIFAAAFWLGLKWRRANAIGAWTSIIGTFSLFYFIPMLLPLLFPALTRNDALLKQTNPAPMERRYTAKAMDVEERAQLILAWEQNPNLSITRPQPIKAGDQIVKSVTLAKKSIFWSKGIKINEQGATFGSGYLYLELLLLDYLGLHLERNPYALNETIRLLIRLIFPFLLLILVALLTPHGNEEDLKRFFIKMRTPVHPDGPEADKNLLSQKMEDYAQTEQILLFQWGDLEFYRWKKYDWGGFLGSWLVVIAILGLLYLVVTVGS